jgi:protein SCO1
MIAPFLLTLALAADPLAESAGPLSSAVPPAVADLAFEQKLGSQVPLDAVFRDEQGKSVRLGDFVSQRPAILVLAYYRCPQLCTLVLNGLLNGLKGLPYRPGMDFKVVIVSFDPRETSELAAAKKEHYLESYARPGAESGWHFLTGEKNQIDRLAGAVGFHYTFDAKHDRFNHPSGIMILTPEGRVSRYLFGIRFLSRDLKLGVMEASDGKVGSVVDQLLLFCFHYDPATGAYSFAVKNAVRAGGVLTVLVMGAMLFRLWRRERQKSEVRDQRSEPPNAQPLTSDL